MVMSQLVSGWHRIMTLATKGMAPQNPARGKIDALDRAVGLNRFKGIGTARRNIPTRRRPQ